jgi:hypothetical protein
MASAWGAAFGNAWGNSWGAPVEDACASAWGNAFGKSWGHSWCHTKIPVLPEISSAGGGQVRVSPSYRKTITPWSSERTYNDTTEINLYQEDQELVDFVIMLVTSGVLNE